MPAGPDTIGAARKSEWIEVFWFFFSKKNSTSFVNSRAQARLPERSKKLGSYSVIC
jgi:hypothetical protein